MMSGSSRFGSEVGRRVAGRPTEERKRKSGDLKLSMEEKKAWNLFFGEWTWLD